MAEVRMRVSKGHKIYNRGGDRAEGEIVFLDSKQARLAKALGRAEYAEVDRPLRVADPQPPLPRPRAPLEQASFVAEGDAAGPQEEDSARRGRRRYQRADMKAED